MKEIEARLVDENSLNQMIDMVNAGRRLVSYTKHCDYCPHYPDLGFMTSAKAREQKETCNCGLAAAVLEAFKP